MSMARDKVVSFWLEESDYARLKKLAEIEGVSLSELVRRAVKEFIESQGCSVPW